MQISYFYIARRDIIMMDFSFPLFPSSLPLSFPSIQEGKTHCCLLSEKEKLIVAPYPRGKNSLLPSIQEGKIHRYLAKISRPSGHCSNKYSMISWLWG